MLLPGCPPVDGPPRYRHHAALLDRAGRVTASVGRTAVRGSWVSRPHNVTTRPSPQAGPRHHRLRDRVGARLAARVALHTRASLVSVCPTRPAAPPPGAVRPRRLRSQERRCPGRHRMPHRRRRGRPRSVVGLHLAPPTNTAAQRLTVPSRYRTSVRCATLRRTSLLAPGRAIDVTPRGGCDPRLRPSAADAMSSPRTEVSTLSNPAVGATEADCLFCKIRCRPPAALPWHDRPLMREIGVGAAVAGLGAFVPGYVLVFPDLHAASTLALPPQHAGSFRALIDIVKRTVEREYGPTTAFEHGSCALTGGRRSACLEHAHVHLMPGTYGLQQAGAQRSETFSIAGTGTVTRDIQNGYLYLHEPGRRESYSADPGVSQYFRRKIADRMGHPDEWDYLVFPHWENVRRTIQTLSRDVA
jgi:diadenosine tetraphosphate (Ap4A) HIT family hydrolase